MRLLYVALTRAKEKLIIVGTEKNLKKALAQKQENYDLSGVNKIPKENIKKSKAYLEWLELIYIYDKDELLKVLDVDSYTKKDILNNEEKTIKIDKSIEPQYSRNKELYSSINEILNWEYKNLIATKTEGKSSVSKITKEQQDTINISEKPKFLEKDLPLSKAEIGTATHIILQKLDFKETYNKEKIKELVEELKAKDIITNNQANSIDIQKINNFTSSEIYERIKEAKYVAKEQPFYTNISVEKIDEKVLIQGIMDIYFIDINDNIVLLDYKTDCVAGEIELVNKYKNQIETYKKALEQATNSIVKEIYIYSTYLNKLIKCNI